MNKQFAESIGGRYLNVYPWNWGRNVKFNAEALRANDLIVLASPIVRLGTTLEREIAWFERLGYQFIDGVLTKVR